MEFKDVINYFNEHYLEYWIKYFKSVKSKRAAWKIVSSAGIEKSSLSTMYERFTSHCYANIEEYIVGLVNIESIPKIIKLLNIHEDKLSRMLEKPLKYIEEKKNKEFNEAYAHYRLKR